MPESKHLHIQYENVAVPEISLETPDNALDEEEHSKDTSNGEIDFEDVALPEIHPKKHPS